MDKKASPKLLLPILVGLFVAAPLFAWVTTPRYTTKTERTNQQFYDVIAQYNKSGVDEPIPKSTILSVKRTQDVWYIVTLHAAGADSDGKMLVADFYHDPKRLTILSPPYQSSFPSGISGIGVPYSVLDELNTNLARLNDGGQDE